MLVARMPVSTFDKLNLIDTVIAFVLLSIVRNFSGIVCVIDTLLCLTLVVFLYKVQLKGWLQKVFNN